MSWQFMDVALRAMADELVKIAAAGDEVPAEDAQTEKDEARKNMISRAKRFGVDAAVGAAGYGLGYGVGKATGAFFGEAHPKMFRSKLTPHLLGAGAMAAGMLARSQQQHRDRYVETGELPK